jgi:hypothetical protein
MNSSNPKLGTHDDNDEITLPVIKATESRILGDRAA